MRAVRLRGQAPVAAAIIVSAAIVLYSPFSAAAAFLTKVSSDSYTVGTSPSQHKTEVEPDVVAYGSTIVATFQVGRFVEGGATNTGWATSLDSGAHWTRGVLPGITTVAGGPYARASDPVVAYDQRSATWLIASLAVNRVGAQFQGVAMVVNASPDGRTWTTPTVVVPQPRIDKEWLACDNTPTSPYYGRCYMEWDDNAHGNLIEMSTSPDGGATWGAPRVTGNNGTGLGGQVLIARNGTVVVPINDAGAANAIRMFDSTDGGTTWSNVVTVAAIHAANNVGLRAEPLVSAAMDRSGRTYMVWSDCRFEALCPANDLVLVTKDLNGVASAPVRIPIGAVGSGADYFVPGIGIDPTTMGNTAHIGITYYYYPNSNCVVATCQLDVGFVSSVDGGQTWSAPLQLAGPMSLSWLAITTLGRMFGDYIKTSYVGPRAYPVFAVATARSGFFSLQFHENMYTPALGLDVTALAAGATTAVRVDEPVLSPPVSSPSPPAPITLH